MTPPPATPTARVTSRHGYLMVLFVIILAFVGVAAAMQVLVLVSVGTTFRAFDAYRQGTTQAARLQNVVTESLLDAKQIRVPGPTPELAQAVADRLSSVCMGGAVVTVKTLPAQLPSIVMFPDATAAPDALTPPAADVQSLLNPELALLIGPRCTTYPALNFEFTTERKVLDISRSYSTRITARLIAVPLTRFPVAAYELPSDIGGEGTSAGSSVTPGIPLGLVPGRDPAFIADLQSGAGVLPYCYRRRAAISAAYQYVFSQMFFDRVAEYAGVTHYCDLGASSGTAVLTGMTSSGTVSTFDLGTAGVGTYNTIKDTRDAVVLYSTAKGLTLRLVDSVGTANSPALFLLIVGPPKTAGGTLTLQLGSIARPVVIIGSNVQITGQTGAAVNGAVLLDPTSAIAPGVTITMGHLSYWAGTSGIPSEAFKPCAMPAAAELIAPRVVYVAAAPQP